MTTKSPSLRSPTIINIPEKLHAKISEASEQVNMKFTSLFKILMTSCVNKYLAHKNFTLPLQSYRGIKKKPIWIEQTDEWKQIKKIAKEIKVSAIDLLLIMLEKEIEEYEASKSLTP